jgi:hypothetical protein
MEEEYGNEVLEEDKQQHSEYDEEVDEIGSDQEKTEGSKMKGESKFHR